jgi:hypothetical protein
MSSFWSRLDLTSKGNLSGFLWNYVSSISTTSLIRRPFSKCYTARISCCPDDLPHERHKYYKTAVETITRRIVQNCKNLVHITHKDRFHSKGSPTLQYFAPLLLALAPRLPGFTLALRDDTSRKFLDATKDIQLESLNYVAMSPAMNWDFLLWLETKLPGLRELIIDFEGPVSTFIALLETINRHSGRLRVIKLAFTASVECPNQVVQLIKAITTTNKDHIGKLSFEFRGPSRLDFSGILNLDSEWDRIELHCLQTYQLPLKEFKLNNMSLWEHVVGNEQLWPKGCRSYFEFDELFLICYGKTVTATSICALSSIISRCDSDEDNLRHDGLRYCCFKVGKWVQTADLDVLMFETSCFKIVSSLVREIAESDENSLPIDLKQSKQSLIELLREVVLLEPSKVSKYGIAYDCLDLFLGDGQWARGSALDLSYCCFPIPTSNPSMMGRPPIRGIIRTRLDTLTKMLPFLGDSLFDARLDDRCILAIVASNYESTPEFHRAILAILRHYTLSKRGMLPIIQELKRGPKSSFIAILQEYDLCFEFVSTFSNFPLVLKAIARCCWDATITGPVLANLFKHGDNVLQERLTTSLYESLISRSKNKGDLEAGLENLLTHNPQPPPTVLNFIDGSLMKCKLGEGSTRRILQDMLDRYQTARAEQPNKSLF